MEPLQHFSHQHPLVFNQERSHESEKAYCSGCGELVLGPSFSCVACGFHLHKNCAEAPSKMSHPFHRNHSFSLLKAHPYRGRCPCDFCYKPCENFVYHCSYGCQLDLHIKCAFLSLNIAEKKIGELQNIVRIDPSIPTENSHEVSKKAKCFACWKPLLESAYLSHHFGFYLHAKCVDLPTETNHLFHPEHPLLLQFNNERLSCKICQKTQWTGFVYCCSPCKFVLHIDCATIPTRINNPPYHKHPLFLVQSIDKGLPCQLCLDTKLVEFGYCCSICKFAIHIECESSPQIIENKSHHPHPFIRFWRRNLFICEACGTSGNLMSYICSTCGIIDHKKCISLPPTLKHPKHPEHPILLTYFLTQDKLDSWDWECRICHLEDVNSNYGSYYCSHCNYIAHVNCAVEDYNWYAFDESRNIDGNLEDCSALLPYSIIKETKHRENVVAIEINHFTHEHNLVLSNDIKDDKNCDGCVLPILSSYYYCSECDFFLHKSCAELPRKKHLWFHNHPQLHPLSSNKIFLCQRCESETNGFDYTCDRCNTSYCLGCAFGSDMRKCEGHEHLLSWIENYKGSCNSCGDSFSGAGGIYRCKRCNFNLHESCLKLPLRARHKFDEHSLQLSYHDNSNYSECYYCDICEGKRNPNHWFYNCSTCNNSAHPECILGGYPFIKLGTTILDERHHPHHLTFVKKVQLYPECHICGEPCLDLALECKNNTGCSFIVHWKCIKRGLLKELQF